ncbi:MAG: FAD:protein FMN transferase, partial [bacterium]|nr:FAD:protein FMN transferase [bacterium]
MGRRIMGFVRRYFFSIVMLLVASAVLFWQPKEFKVSGTTMGTDYHVVAYKRGVVFDNPIKEAIESRLVAFSFVFSTYDNQSEINKINTYVGEGGIAISDGFKVMFELGSTLYALTGGAWDGTILPVLSVWGFGPNSTSIPSVPSDSTLSKARKVVGWDLWSLRPFVRRNGWSSITRGFKLFRSVPGTMLDFNSIAKGYGVDVIAQELDDRGFDSYFVEIGGEVRVKGVKPSLVPWRVGLQTPLP